MTFSLAEIKEPEPCLNRTGCHALDPEAFCYSLYRKLGILSVVNTLLPQKHVLGRAL